MNSHRSTCRIVLTCALAMAAGASTARSDIYDPMGIQYHYKPWGSWGPEFTAPNVPRIANVLQGRASSNPHVAQRVAPSRTSRFDDLNLSVNMPTGPWVKQDPKKTGSKACYLISRSKPTIVISLAGERVGTNEGGTNKLLAESQAKMMALPGGAVEPGEQQLTAGGIEGIAYEATAAQGKATTHYSIWVAAHHGYNYKLAVYGDQKDEAAIDEAMNNFVRGIKQIQPTRVARAASNTKSH